MRGEPEPMTPKTRRRFTPDQKAAIVRRHLEDKVPISDLCDEYEIPAEHALHVAEGRPRERFARVWRCH